MSNLVLTRRAGDCVRLELRPGFFVLLLVGYVGGDQVKFEVMGGPDWYKTERVKVSSALVLTPDVSVQLVDIRFGVAKLRFDAPLSVKIVRTELLEKEAAQ